MDSFRKHANKFREQVAKQQQAVARQLSSYNAPTTGDVIITDEAELQRHQQLDKLFNSTRTTKHYQRDIVKGIEGAALAGTKQIEVVNKLCEEICKYSSESLGNSGMLGKSLSYYGVHRARLEREREILFNTLNSQVAEPLKAMVNGAPLEDARHLVQRYERMRQEAETQGVEVTRRRSRLRESGGGSENAMRTQVAEAKMQEIVSSMALLGKEAAAAMTAVETQQQRLTLQRLISLVESERSYHKRATEILDQILAQILLEKQRYDSLPPTIKNISVVDTATKGLEAQEESDISKSMEGLAIDTTNGFQNIYIGEVMNAFEAEAEGELSLSVGDYVVVRQVSHSGWSEGECKGRAGWFPSAYVVPRHQVPGSKLMEENGVHMRTSKIWTSDERVRGLGLFSSSDDNTGVLMVSPLYLAITPMSVLQHQELGSSFGRLFEDGEVDDRLLMILFLMIERIQGSSSFWAPYLDVLPTTFGTPLWFTEKEMEELKGTSLYNATRIQLKNLKAHFTDKVKPFAEALLSSLGALEREVDYEDFLWANCIFWTRALNIPCPHSFVFPNQVTEKESTDIENGGVCEKQISKSKEIVWVEGLVPGIDFCNHDPKAVTHWEVDGEEGLKTGMPYSMYLITDGHLSLNDEILISYGNKGNEELLFLYGFVIDMNPDDYFMVHFPKEALDQDPSNETKIQLLQEQDLTLRWLLPGSLLQKGFFPEEGIDSAIEIGQNGEAYTNSFSWSGNRKAPSFLHQFVFPEDTMAALRVVSMKDDELNRVVSMLEELSQSGQQITPSSEDIRAAVWEVCGNVAALQLLVDLISARLLDLEDGTGTEETDKEILNRDNQEQDGNKLTKNVRNCIVYRRWQKHFAKRFLREAERLLELSILEDQS